VFFFFFLGMDHSVYRLRFIEFENVRREAKIATGGRAIV